VRAERGIGQIDRDEHPHGGNRRDVQVTGTRNLKIHHNTLADWRNRLAPISDTGDTKVSPSARVMGSARTDQQVGQGHRTAEEKPGAPWNAAQDQNRAARQNYGLILIALSAGPCESSKSLSVLKSARNAV
jgi:hypothetical protein